MFAVVRGDMEVNKTKLANAVKALDLRPATEDEIRAIGAIAGYASPIGVKGCIVVVDDAIPVSPNLVAGANETGYHLRNVNYGRDYRADVVADITSAREGDLGPDGQGVLREVRGIEVGNIFKLGTRYSQAMNALFLDMDGQTKPIVMGSYGIGITRLLACIAEAHHDDKGLILPMSIAPYPVHLILIPSDSEVRDAADRFYERLQGAGVEVLYDDREERAGVKFNDADLIGIPLRLTISQRSIERGGGEYKRRGKEESSILSVEEVVSRMRSEIEVLLAEFA